MTTNKFKTPGGVRYLKALFYETTLADKSTVLYTLKDQDHQGYPSLYRLYLACEDWTEHTFATSYLDGWEHWEQLCKCNWFKPYIEAWRKELETILKARLLNRLLEDAHDTTSKTSTSSAKFLLQEGWAKEGKATAKRGRPSKDEIAQEANRLAELDNRTDYDFQRLHDDSRLTKDLN